MAKGGQAVGLRALCALAFLGPAVALAEQGAKITSAAYEGPTRAYDHGILGDAIEWTQLALGLSDGSKRRIRLPQNHVFEDTAPRLVDVDGDGAPEVITVETRFDLGARLAIYDENGFVAAAPFIGRTHRWLAPVGAADLDGDGAVEIAYIDRPHLAKTLRIWRYEAGALELVAEAGGVTNHRIGDADIAGGLRDCGAGIEMVTLNADWSRIMISTLSDGRIARRDAGAMTGAPAMEAAFGCR
ncbi:VCBS repeat-containing protein [Litorivita sp. NS0012-18]|uniref:FG-GAP repeat domain-containing protein n=1 Tax=Litorivita sp. NS0012-18 TaxID=3127655 RepID=UPI003107C81C